MRLLLTIGCAASILAVGGTDFSTIPWLVRGASLTLRHSAEPQAPGITSHAEISGVSTTPPAFTVTMKHNQNNFIGGAVLPREGFFDFSGHTVLACEIENLSEWPVDVMLRIHSGTDIHNPTGRPEMGIYLMPHEKKTLRIPLYPFCKNNKVTLAPQGGSSQARLDNPYGIPYVQPMMHGKPFGIPGMTGIDAEHVNAMIFWSMTPYLRRDQKKSAFRITNLRFTDELPPNEAPLDTPSKYFPFVDRYGQYRHADWPGKIHSDEELRESARQEALQWKPRPADWNRYGGYKSGPTRKATGFFRTEKYDGKWYLVDPEGKLFFSMGVNSVAWGTLEFIDGREHYFSEKGVYSTRFKRHTLNHQERGNRIQWGTATPEEVFRKRFDSWGINTLGPWTDMEFLKKMRRPYTVLLRQNDRFCDGFDPAFRKALLADLNYFHWTIQDPMCIGYFVTNEMYYGGPTGWAKIMMQKNAEQPGKLKFKEFLEQRYQSIVSLNQAWDKSYSDFNSFLSDTQPPVTDAGKRDLEEFSRILIRKFFAVSRDVLKSVAPNHLFLGSRFQMSAGAAYDFLAELFPEYCDVASYNCYWLGLDHFSPQIPDMPIMITEFSIGGAFTRGHFYSSLSVSGFTPEERKEALRRYYESALRNPRIVGMHYFCLMDQPLCGRWSDGENMNLGILDSTSRPFPEVTEAIREIAEKAIPYRMSR